MCKAHVNYDDGTQLDDITILIITTTRMKKNWLYIAKDQGIEKT